MPRIIVTADHDAVAQPPVLLEERVQSLHIDNDHGARALIERLTWALRDAELLEGAPAARVPAPEPKPPRRHCAEAAPPLPAPGRA